MDYDLSLTQLVHQYARDLGADLVGIANVERYEHAPLLLSPQGHFPRARNIVVVAMTHTDGAVEMGGRPTPHDFGPYAFQETMNTRNEHIVWALARVIHDNGWRAIPMPATNIWRFRPYGGMTRPFIPDISDIHAGAAAGLGEIGYSGLLLTPEFGPRQRLCTLITNAPLQPTPLYRGEPLCDRCLMCARHCLTQAYDKEVDGECEVIIEDKVMRYANKSIWRCSWAEHYGLDIDLPKPDVITEEAILDNLAAHGRRGGEMGSCLRFCLPPQLRHRDPDYTDTVRRRSDTSGDGREIDRPATWEAQRIAFDWGACAVSVADETRCAQAGLDLKPRLPDGRRLLAFAFTWPEGGSAAGRGSQPAPELAAALSDLRYFDEDGEVVIDGFGRRAVIGNVITSALLQPGSAVNPAPAARELWPLLSCLAGRRLSRTHAMDSVSKACDDNRLAKGRLFNALVGTVDLIGFAPAARTDEFASELERILDTKAMSFFAVDQGSRHGPVVPEVHRRPDPIIRRASNWLEGAASVIVLGVPVPETIVRRATEPPADAVGPYAYAVYQARRELRYAAYWIAQALAAGGYRAAVADDLMGTGSVQANPRGLQPDFRCSRFAAVAAGLGQMLHTGAVWTPEHDTRGLFISIVTDAPLPATPLLDAPSPCDSCDHPCVSACPTAALGADTVEVQVEGCSVSFGALEWVRCEWAKRYGLVADEGPRWIGSPIDIQPPEGKVTPDDILAAYAQLDPSQKHRMCIVEPCVRACHFKLTGSKR